MVTRTVPGMVRKAKVAHMPQAGKKTLTAKAGTGVKGTGVLLEMGDGGRDKEDEEFEKF